MDVPSLLRETTDIIISLDTEYTLEIPELPPALGISDTGLPHAAQRRKHPRNHPLSYQWIAVEAATGHTRRQIIKPEKNDPRPNLGDLVRSAALDLGYNLEVLRHRKGHTPLRVIVIWHWGSAEMGLLADRARLMDPDKNIVSLGGGVVTLEPGPLSVPLRDEHGHYGEVTLTIADTSRLMDPDNAKSLEKLGVGLGIPKIDIEARGYDKSCMDKLLDEDPELFDQYAMRDCEIALMWLFNCARTQREVLHLDRLSPTTGAASAAGLKRFLEGQEEGFSERFATYFSRSRQEYVPTPRRGENESYVIQAFAGGMNQSYHLGHVHGDIVDLDLDGAYAGAMGILPGIDWEVDAATEEKDPWKLTDLMTFVGVKFQFPRDTQFPSLPVWTEKHGLIFPLSNEEQRQPTYVTGVELGEALRMGCRVQVMSARRFKLKGLLVHGFLRYLTDLRMQYPKGTAYNTAAKLSINTLFGKFGQGLAYRCSNDELFSEDELTADKKIKRCSVTLPHAAATITGLVRAVLGVLVREASKVGTVLSATTDGAMIQLDPNTNRKETLKQLLTACEEHPALQLFMEGRNNLGLDPAKWLEVKHEGTEAATIRTRMNWIGREGQTVYEARVGFERDTEKPGYVPFRELETIIQERRLCYYTEARLNKISDVMEGRASDITTYYQSKKVNLCPDWKRCFHQDGTSRPFASMAEYWRYRQVANALDCDAWPDLVQFQVARGYTAPARLEQAVRREVLHRVALGVPGFRLPRGTTFKLACQALGGISEKALSKLRRERLASSDFPDRHPEVGRIRGILNLW
jgi:hypothetical protein